MSQDSENADFDKERLLRRLRELSAAIRTSPAVSRREPRVRAETKVDRRHIDLAEGHLRDAQALADVGSKVPEMRKVRGLMRLIATPAAKLILRAGELIARDQRHFNNAMVHVSADLIRHLQASVASISRVEQQWERFNQSQGPEFENAIQLLNARLASAEEALQRANDAHAATAKQAARAIEDLSTRVTSVTEQLFAANARFRGDAAGAGIPDDVYIEFENRFRGSRDDIKARVSRYVEVFRGQGVGKSDSPILELGPGRGELLELLRQAGLRGRGVDSNPGMVKQCRDLGLDVTLDDALRVVASAAADSLGAVIGVQFIEHIPFGALLKLFADSVRALKEGGLLIVETPNPQNLLVGASSF